MARPSYPSDDTDKLLLRFPEGMRDALKTVADEAGRSLNAEIIQRLKRTLKDDAIAAEREKVRQAIRSGPVDLNELAATIERLRHDFDDLRQLQQQLPSLQGERDE